VYGLGEQIAPLNLPIAGPAGQKYTLFAKDQGTPQHSPAGGSQTYGSYPFVLVGDAKGRAHGIMLLNSNTMDVILTDAGAATGSITYRTTGGILDLFFFAGPKPLDVTRDLSATLGFPALPPYWGLGFHLCRWGYKDINETAAVVSAMRAAQLPHDVMWNDIDYMSQYLDFTSDAHRYPMQHMRSFVDDLHAHGQHYVMITDPGISSTQPHGAYPPLDEGVAGDVFINISGKQLVGKVWPGLVYYPDFFRPSTLVWWRNQIGSFHDELDFDGMW
jgi:alpha-glucosidase (family GH31 glycosyl hydrolase)